MLSVVIVQSSLSVCFCTGPSALNTCFNKLGSSFSNSFQVIHVGSNAFKLDTIFLGHLA